MSTENGATLFCLYHAIRHVYGDRYGLSQSAGEGALTSLYCCLQPDLPPGYYDVSVGKQWLIVNRKPELQGQNENKNQTKNRSESNFFKKKIFRNSFLTHPFAEPAGRVGQPRLQGRGHRGRPVGDQRGAHQEVAQQVDLSPPPPPLLYTIQ